MRSFEQRLSFIRSIRKGKQLGRKKFCKNLLFLVVWHLADALWFLCGSLVKHLLIFTSAEVRNWNDIHFIMVFAYGLYHSFLFCFCFSSTFHSILLVSVCMIILLYSFTREVTTMLSISRPSFHRKINIPRPWQTIPCAPGPSLSGRSYLLVKPE